MKKGFQKNVFDKEKLLAALWKRAEGFFYFEEVLEYGEKEEKKIKGAVTSGKNNKDVQDALQDNLICDFCPDDDNEILGKTRFENEDVLGEYDFLMAKNFDGQAHACIGEKRFLKNNVSKINGFQKSGLYSVRDEEEKADLQPDRTKNENTQNLVLVKKKVTTHYIPPDLAAVKMLIENFGEEVVGEQNMIDSMSDEELIKIRDELIKDLKDN